MAGAIERRPGRDNFVYVLLALKAYVSVYSFMDDWIVEVVRK